MIRTNRYLVNNDCVDVWILSEFLFLVSKEQVLSFLHMDNLHVLIHVGEDLLRENFLETEVFLFELEEDRFGSGGFGLGWLVGVR